MAKKYQYALNIIRYLLALVFLLSGIGKIIDGKSASVVLIQLIGNHDYNSTLIIFLSIVEIIISISLLLGTNIKWSLAISLIVITCFTGVLSYFYIQGVNIADCGCFGVFHTGMGLELSLFKNFILIALIIGAYLIFRKQLEKISIIR